MVLMSGSIYNKSELLPLCNIDVPVPDPQLIANLFLSGGQDFVNQLNGDFTIFILQAALKQAYLFRDQVGIRPIAWATDNQTLLFSSNILGLCRALSDGKPADNDYLLGYFKYLDYRKTPDKQVKKLLPGYFLCFSERGIEVCKYWQPGKIKIDKELKYDGLLSDLKNIVRDAIKIRCDNRFNAGAHVSSGIDSGIVAALAKEQYTHQEKFYGFSWSPDKSNKGEVKYDERDLISRFGSDKAITPVFSDMNRDDFLRIITSFYGNPGLFYEDRTVEQAAELGVNLIFSGWGGDEFISTGDRGIEQDLLSRLKLQTFFRRNPVRPVRRFVKNQLLYVLFPALGILDKGTRQSFRDDARYLKKPFRKSDRGAIRNFFFHTSRRQMHLRMLQFYHLQRRCENWMVSGYRHGVEYRYPLLDRRIIEYMLKVPSDLLCRTDQFRPLLRELGKGILPDEIRLNKSKTDPVSWLYTQELFRTTALSFIGEADEWKANPDLSFLDFGILIQDIEKYHESANRTNDMVFFKALINIKAVHEFTKRFREKG